MGSCRGRHRLPGAYMRHFSFPKVIKKPLFPLGGTRTEKQFLRYHLVCRKSDRSARRQHAVCPLTLAMRQKILRSTHFPLPSAAHLLPRFSLCSQLCRTLCGCALQLYFRFVGFNLCYAIYTSFVYVCQELFFTERGLFSQYSRTTALTTPMISALVPSMGL